jgi:hypothetical protein
VLAIDVGLAVLLAALVLILTPGVAVAGIIAIVVVVVCVISLVWDARRGRSRTVRSPRRTSRRR